MSTVREGRGGSGTREVDKKRDKGAQRAARSGSREVRNSNGADYVISEVAADLRFLRVSKSYASITNRILSVALVRHDQIGVSLVAGNGTSTEPLIVTHAYKKEELQNKTPPTHLSSPTRDCTVEVNTVDSKLGEHISLSVTVTNHGHMLRTLDGKVEGHIIRSKLHYR